MMSTKGSPIELHGQNYYFLDSQVAAFFSPGCWFLGSSAWKKTIAPGDPGISHVASRIGRSRCLRAPVPHIAVGQQALAPMCTACGQGTRGRFRWAHWKNAETPGDFPVAFVCWVVWHISAPCGWEVRSGFVAGGFGKGARLFSSWGPLKPTNQYVAIEGTTRPTLPPFFTLGGFRPKMRGPNFGVHYKTRTRKGIDLLGTRLPCKLVWDPKKREGSCPPKRDAAGSELWAPNCCRPGVQGLCGKKMGGGAFGCFS